MSMMQSLHIRFLSFGWVMISFGTGCSMGRLAEVSPNEIPELEARLARQPQDGDLVLRYAAALFSAARCDTATVVAERGRQLSPANTVAPLVIGQCLEQAGRSDQAIATYRTFIEQHPEARGVRAVRGREAIAQRSWATTVARQTLQAEDSLSVLPPDPDALAVLPLLVAGDSAYQTLSLGLATIIVSDLSLLDRFRLVERLRLQALIDEIGLSRADRVQAETALRLGRLTRAGRLVQGAATIEPAGATRLEAGIVLPSGEAVSPASVGGEFRDLMRLEKELVFAIVNQLGYQLTVAERQRILENGTQSLGAFLAYADGLEAERNGNYRAAAVHFSRAVQEDPGFSAASEELSTTTGAAVVEVATPGQVTTVGATTETSAQPPVPGPVAGAMGSAVGDVAGTQAETATASAGEVSSQGQEATMSNTANPQPTVATFYRLISVTVRIRIP